MALISSNDRANLFKVLTAEMPSVQNPALRGVLTLMLALLHDYETLETLAREQLHVASDLAAELSRLSAELHGMAERKSGKGDMGLQKTLLQ